jgi:hypothetical protein
MLQLPPDMLRHMVFYQERLDKCTLVLARFVCRFFRAVIPLLERGTPWGADICVLAARAGNLKALQWARARGAPWDTRVCSAAARNGHLHVLARREQDGANGVALQRLQEVIWTCCTGLPFQVHQWT